MTTGKSFTIAELRKFATNAPFPNGNAMTARRFQVPVAALFQGVLPVGWEHTTLSVHLMDEEGKIRILLNNTPEDGIQINGLELSNVTRHVTIHKKPSEDYSLYICI